MCVSICLKEACLFTYLCNYEYVCVSVCVCVLKKKVYDLYIDVAFYDQIMKYQLILAKTK